MDINQSYRMKKFLLMTLKRLTSIIAKKKPYFQLITVYPLTKKVHFCLLS
ncbi:hypothetical protein FM106_11110 [Brachybacterium faecium]|uniref:Uncharacterized protein n=1 Tax=Brochothrix thermosphacta TaxID=2756 RepID=A0A2X0S6L8_BROTH|nr:hypothetical protein FM106_11110 [Brachybacterium faecium]SOC29048.1 hypothetical protein BTH160X_50162 [Brochothrix thermosphacta]SPP28372.1 conserved hypothetical protein [Brochothrix thermosphacta]